MAEITPLVIEKEGIGVFTDSPGGTTTTPRMDFNAPAIYHDEVNFWSGDTRPTGLKKLTVNSGITESANGRIGTGAGLYMYKIGNTVTICGQIAFTPTTGVVTICATGTIPVGLRPAYTVVTWNPSASAQMTLIRAVADGSIAAIGTWKCGESAKQTSALSWCSVWLQYNVDTYDDITSYAW